MKSTAYLIWEQEVPGIIENGQDLEFGHKQIRHWKKNVWPRIKKKP